jgi:hypothetical protein
MTQVLSMPYAADIPRLFVIAERPLQRIALAEIINACGYEIVENIPPDRLQNHHLLAGPDLWLIDVSNEEEVMERIGFDAPVMLGIDPAPQPGDRQAYGRWMRILSRKLVKLLGKPPPLLTHVVSDADDDIEEAVAPAWLQVCILAASMGGPSAVKAFLDALPTDIPVAFILVQHIDPHMQEILPRILVRHNHWRCTLMHDDPMPLNLGEILIVPATRQVTVDEHGVLTPKNERWPAQYQPSISEMMRRVSDVFADRLRVIVFSGMGDDGSNVAHQVCQQGGLIWAQTAASSDCASQPDSMRATGMVAFSGTPEALAQQLRKEMQDLIAQGVRQHHAH